MKISSLICSRKKKKKTNRTSNPPALFHRPQALRDAVTVDEIKALEACAYEQGFSEDLLIENASSNLAAAVDALALGTQVLVVAGWGNNGADSLACGRKLAARGYRIRAFLLQEQTPNRFVVFQRKLLAALGITVELLNEKNFSHFLRAAHDCDFIIDGILGIGAHGAFSDAIVNVIAALNEAARPIVACDIPSGLVADTGKILGAAIKAQYTVTFLAAKKAFGNPSARRYCGKIITVDIGASRAQLAALRRTRVR